MMKFLRNLINSNKNNVENKQDYEFSEEFNDDGFSNEDLLHYDEHLDFYYSNLINSLILFTYSSEELQKMEPILFDPLTELYEELDYAFIPVLFETIFRNNIINNKHKEELLDFRKQVEEIPNEIWDYPYIGVHPKWKDIQIFAENILHQLNIETRIFNTQFHTVLSKEGKTIFKGKEKNE